MGTPTWRVYRDQVGSGIHIYGGVKRSCRAGSVAMVSTLVWAMAWDLLFGSATGTRLRGEGRGARGEGDQG